MKLLKTFTGVIILLLKLIFISTTVMAQQVPVYTMQEMVRPGVNPAYTGLDEVYDLVLLTRQQWVGINGAPRSYYLSSNVPLSSRKTGVGFVLQNQSSGPYSRTGLFLNYSYTINITESSTLSFGLRGGFNTYSIKVSDLRVIDQGDLLFENDVSGLFLPNAGIGAHYRLKNYFIDFSIPTLIRNELRPKGTEKAGKDNMEDRMYNLGVGADFILSEGFSLQPAIATWFAKGTPPLIDLRLSASIQDAIKIGLAYRISGSISGYFTYRILGNFMIGYAYELPIAYDYRISSGTHEIVLGLDFQMFKKKTLSPRRF